MIRPEIVESKNFYLLPLNIVTIENTIKGGDFKEILETKIGSKEFLFKENWAGGIKKDIIKLNKSFDDEVPGTFIITGKNSSEALGIIGIKYEAPDLSDLLLVEFHIGLRQDFENRENFKEIAEAFTHFMASRSDFARLMMRGNKDDAMTETLMELGFEKTEDSHGNLVYKKDISK